MAEYIDRTDLLDVGEELLDKTLAQISRRLREAATVVEDTRRAPLSSRGIEEGWAYSMSAAKVIAEVHQKLTEAHLEDLVKIAAEADYYAREARRSIRERERDLEERDALVRREDTDD